MLYTVTIHTDAAGEDLATETLFALGAQSVSATMEKDSLIISSLFESDSRSILGENLHNEFPAAVIGAVDDSWKNRWSENFTCAELTGHTAAVAEGVPSPGYRTEILLDPNGAFGAGTHPTTKLCIRFLESLFEEKDPSGLSVIDIGTGSGISAIYASLRGAAYVEGFDIDPAAVEIAKYNAALNRTAPVLRQGDISGYPSQRRFDIVVANLQTEIIESNLDNILDLAAPAGYILISGILNIWRDQVESLFTRKGLRVTRTEELDSWLAFLLVEG